MVRLVLVSDTHGRHGDLVVPDGDVLVHAGDFTRRGHRREVEAFARFLGGLPHAHKVVVAGNHDFLCQREPERAAALLGEHAHYLLDSGVEALGLSFWGSPWQPWFHDWAFNLPRGAPLAERWALVPGGVDVLVTHGPPLGVLDRTARGVEVGCEALAEALPRIRPRLHVFGHIHEARGVAEFAGALCVNASTLDLAYAAVRPAIVVDLEDGAARVVPPRSIP